MYYGELKKNDIANGEGVRVSLFVSGCRNCCPGCFNRETWSFSYGKKFDEEAQRELFDALSPSYVRGLTLLGGEPMEPENQAELLPLLRKVKELYPEKTVWIFSGYTYEMLTSPVGIFAVSTEHTSELLSLCDILVDGRFEEDKKSIGLRFRGSSNQRIIDLVTTRRRGEIVIWHGCAEDRFFGGDKNGT